MKASHGLILGALVLMPMAAVAWPICQEGYQDSDWLFQQAIDRWVTPRSSPWANQGYRPGGNYHFVPGAGWPVYARARQYPASYDIYARYSWRGYTYNYQPWNQWYWSMYSPTRYDNSRRKYGPFTGLSVSH